MTLHFLGRDLPDGYDGRGDGDGPCAVAPQHFRWPNHGSIDNAFMSVEEERCAAAQPAVEARTLIDTTQRHWVDILARAIDGCVDTVAPVLVREGKGSRRHIRVVVVPCLTGSLWNAVCCMLYE